MNNTQQFHHRTSQIVMVGHFPSTRHTASILAAYIEKQDRRILAKYPRGFIRRYVPGEFAPYIVDGCGWVAVSWHEGKVLRVSVGLCRMAAGWREDYMDTGIPSRRLSWPAQEEALSNVGLNPRQAPLAVQAARRAAWDLEEKLYPVMGGYKKMPYQLRKVWARKNLIPLVAEVDGE